MTTASEEILARYQKTFSEADKFGRVITVGPLRPADELRVLRMIGTDERTNQVTYLALASIRKLDDAVISKAQNLGELDALLNKLDREGMDALGAAYRKMKEADAPESEAMIEAEKEALKN